MPNKRNLKDCIYSIEHYLCVAVRTFKLCLSDITHHSWHKNSRKHADNGNNHHKLHQSKAFFIHVFPSILSSEY